MINPPTTPQAGDVVICTSGELLGQTAFINGKRTSNQQDWEICFGSTARADGEEINCMGGLRLHTSNLLHTGRKAEAIHNVTPVGLAGLIEGKPSKVMVNLWEYRDTTPNACFKGVFSIESLEQRQKMTFNPFRHCKDTNKKFYDDLSKLIFDAIKTFSILSWSKSKKPDEKGCSYHAYVNWYGIGSFKTKVELLDFLSGYNLQTVETDTEGGALEGNLDTSSWPKLAKEYVN